MAIIFYYKDSGKIYGVHPDKDIHVPERVSYIEVSESPENINWPGAGEHYSKVDLSTLTLVKDGEPEPDPDEELAKAIQSSATFEELKAALLGNKRMGAVKGRPK